MDMDQIPNVLACDVGNTSIRIAHVCGEKVIGERKFRVGALNGLGEGLAELWESIPEPKKIAAGSVNPAALKALEAAVAETIGKPVLVIGRDLPLPIETAIDEPEKTGVDRLCAAAAAFDRLGVACIIGDFGTAITIDCVNDEGVFLGGAILPGLAMSAASLKANTAALPLVEPVSPTWVFGRNTQQAIAGGIVFGARGALRELVESYATEMGHWPLVIITGGDAKLICEDPNNSGLVQAIVPDLVIRGVALAYYKSIVPQR